MKIFHARLFKLICAVAVLLGWRMSATAQTLTVTPSASQVTVNGTLTYNISVVNNTGTTIQQLVVTDVMPPSAGFISATNNLGFASNNLGSVVFQVLNFSNTPAIMALTVSPSNTTTLTNLIYVSTNFFAAFTNYTTNIITTSVFSGQSDLSVALNFTPAQILTNDWVIYTLAVTNSGSNSVSGVILSNTVPPDTGIISVTPANTSLASNTLIFNIGTLAGKGFKTYQVRVQPTNAGPHTFTASVSGTGSLDTNSVNNTASTNINVVEGLSTNFTVSGFSAQVFNPQTGLVEQTVNLANTDTNSSPSTRVSLLGFTNWVYNAAGTNNGHPFVLFSGTLDGGANTNLNLKYFIPSKSPVANPTASAVGVPFFNPPLPPGTNVTLNKTNFALAPGVALIEFPSVLGRQYTIAYIDGALGSNWMVVQPRVTAPGSRVQWIDDGPPATISKPGSGSRYYRAIAN